METNEPIDSELVFFQIWYLFKKILITKFRNQFPSILGTFPFLIPFHLKPKIALNQVLNSVALRRIDGAEYSANEAVLAKIPPQSTLPHSDLMLVGLECDSMHARNRLSGPQQILTTFSSKLKRKVLKSLR